MSIHTMHFASDGTAHCLWTEVIPLTELGQLSLQRASTIEFNNATQVWEVRLTSHPNQVVFSNSSRESCLQWEATIFNQSSEIP